MKQIKTIKNHTDISRKSNWENTVNEIDMKHSSRVAWQTINRLTGRNKKAQNSNDVKAKDVAKCLINNSKTADINHEFTYCVNREIKQLWNSSSADSNLCNGFSTEELKRASGDLKNGKAPGVDKMHTEFLKNLAASTKVWLLSFFNMLICNCMYRTKIPKIWREAKVIAVLKPNKPPSDPKSYQSIINYNKTYSE